MTVEAKIELFNEGDTVPSDWYTFEPNGDFVEGNAVFGCDVEAWTTDEIRHVWMTTPLTKKGVTIFRGWRNGTITFTPLTYFHASKVLIRCVTG